MKLIIAAIGRLKSGPERELCDRYTERLRPLARTIGFAELKLVEISESSQRRPDDRKRDEGEAIRRALPDGAALIAFDERGQSPASEEFASRIAALRQAGPPAVAFVIGGPDGLDPAFRDEAVAVFSFGRMTMPHQLVRALVLEQLYRAGTILTGHPYHRA